jgi:hypothetical protein
MNEERTGEWLRQTEHIRGHLWHRYSIAVNQVMVATAYNFEVKVFNNLTTSNPWFSSFLFSSNPLSRKSWQEPQPLEFGSAERYILHMYWGAAERLLHINEKFTMVKLKSSLKSYSFVLKRTSLTVLIFLPCLPCPEVIRLGLGPLRPVLTVLLILVYLI